MTAPSEVALPSGAEPRHYKLCFEPYLDECIFSGSVELQIDVSDAILRSITIHALDLDVSQESCYFTPSGGTAIPCTGISYNKDAQTANISFAEPLGAGLGVLGCTWVGELNDKLCGFYRSSYKDLAGKKRFMATTQFEATDARRAFPCWDEPARKATFEISMVVPSNLQAISNMPVVARQSLGDGGKVLIRYDKTPIMSTYLVAMVVGEFDSVSSLGANGVTTTVYTPKGKTQLAAHALQVASKALIFFEEQFGIPFPLPKSDLLAIPDFAAGAMENWGCVTYRETRLLIDDANATLAARTATTRTVSHELAHMWFGNLVTMAWWTQLWLNEGFARFMEFKAVDAQFPQWEVWLQFISSVQSVALRLDALTSTHPIEVPVKHPDEVNEIFDAISYAKGASVLRMLHNVYLGGDAFMAGVRRYLERHAYSNASTKDLWAALSEASGKDVGKLMRKWTGDEGFPLISVREIEPPTAAGERRFALSQRRFLANGASEAEGASPWCVPLRILSSDGETTEILETHEKEVRFAGRGWVRFNAGQGGFYRVARFREGDAASDAALAALCAAIADSSLATADVLGVVSDAFAVARAGLGPLAAALKLAKACASRGELALIQQLYDDLSDLLSVHAEGEPIEPLREFCRSLFGPLGWEKRDGETETDVRKRATVLSMLAKSEHEATVASAKALHAEGAPLVADLRLTVYRLAVEHGGDVEYERMLDSYRNTDETHEKRRLLLALSAAPDAALQLRTLRWAMDSDEVRGQDMGMLVAAVAGAKGGGATTCWEWISVNFGTINERFGAGQSWLLSRIFGAATRSLAGVESPESIEAFYAAHPVPSAKRAISQSLEHVRLVGARKAREVAQLHKFFH